MPTACGRSVRSVVRRDFEPANPRPAAPPEVGGTSAVAGMNLLNFFNTFDGCLHRRQLRSARADRLPRRGQRQAEFDRQWPKTSPPSSALDADVVGVNEIENDGYGPTARSRYLVDQLNAATAPGTFAFIDVDAAPARSTPLGTDAIKVGLIYRPARSRRSARPAALTAIAFVNGGDDAPRSRPSLAQAFETVDGARFIVVVNHLKSKGSACDAARRGRRPGQLQRRPRRTPPTALRRRGSRRDPTGTGDPDVLIVGDLNSYAGEDPIASLEDAGLHQPGRGVRRRRRTRTSSTASGATSTTRWLGLAGRAGHRRRRVAHQRRRAGGARLQHRLQDRRPDRQPVRARPVPDSDHDPVLVGLDPVNDPPSVDAGGPYTVVEGGSVSVAATGQDPEGTAVSFAWDLDGLPAASRPAGQQVSFSAAGLQAPLTRDDPGPRDRRASANQAIDEATVKVIWSFAFRRPLIAPPAVNAWIAALPVLVPFTLAGNQGLGVLDGTPTFTRDPLHDPRSDRPTRRHLDDRAGAGLRASDGHVRVHLEDDAVLGQDVRDAAHRSR